MRDDMFKDQYLWMVECKEIDGDDWLNEISFYTRKEARNYIKYIKDNGLVYDCKFRIRKWKIVYNDCGVVT